MSLAISLRKLIGTKVNNLYMIGGYINRNYAKIDEYNIKWTRPERIPEIDPKQSGDLGLDISVKPTDIRLYYEKSKELEGVDEKVRRIFEIKFQRKKEFRNLKREKIIGLVKRHNNDRGSVEVKIAAMTSEIHDLQQHMKEHPRNKKVKVFLKELIDKRRKQLKHLRTWDYGRFEWILEQLNLVYKPLPLEPGMVSRKESIKRLTEEYCNNIIQKKFDRFKAEIRKKQQEFYPKKAEILEFILKEEKECGLNPTVTEEDIENARKKAELLNNSETVN